jgi:hypothetical protein
VEQIASLELVEQLSPLDEEHQVIELLFLMLIFLLDLFHLSMLLMVDKNIVVSTGYVRKSVPKHLKSKNKFIQRTERGKKFLLSYAYRQYVVVML